MQRPKEIQMRRIVAVEYLSLDGVMEDPGPTGEYEHRGWTMPYWNDGTGQHFFSDAADKSILALKRAETSGTGVTMLVCEPAP